MKFNQKIFNYLLNSEYFNFRSPSINFSIKNSLFSKVKGWQNGRECKFKFWSVSSVHDFESWRTATEANTVNTYFPGGGIVLCPNWPAWMYINLNLNGRSWIVVSRQKLIFSRGGGHFVLCRARSNRFQFEIVRIDRTFLSLFLFRHAKATFEETSSTDTKQFDSIELLASTLIKSFN